ncbi:hypothetical protein [Parasphingorhabdus sp.]|uniref:hypothetical protein n=1 Tax=Parasphingorhabdus sp. TaxID=2709688 RepID=UPI003D269BEE
MSKQDEIDWAENNSSAMKSAIAWLEGQKIRFKQVSQFQLKVDDVNYYPGSQTVKYDGKKKERFSSWGMFQAIALEKKKQELKMLEKTQGHDL